MSSARGSHASEPGADAACDSRRALRRGIVWGLAVVMLATAADAAAQTRSRLIEFRAERGLVGLPDLDYDTGWVPEFSPAKLRFKTLVSEPKVEASVTGFLNFDGQDVWFSDGAGSLRTKGGIEFWIRGRIFVPDSPIRGLDLDVGGEDGFDLPLLPSIDQGWDESTEFSGLLLGSSPPAEVSIQTSKLKIVEADIVGLVATALGGPGAKMVANNTLEAGIGVYFRQEFGIRLAGEAIRIGFSDLTFEGQRIPAPGLEPFATTYIAAPRYRESFSAGYSWILSGEVFVRLLPIKVWNLEFTVWEKQWPVAELSIPIIPHVPISLPFSTDDRAVFAIQPPDTLQAVQAPSVGDVTLGSVTSLQLTAQGGTPPYVWYPASGSLPTGLDITGTGRIAGTPTKRESTTASFVVKDASQQTATTAEIAFTVRPPVVVTGTLAFSGPTPPRVGDAVTAQFTVRNDGRGHVRMAKLTAAVRGPNGVNVDFPPHPSDYYIELDPGESYPYESTRTFPEAGAYEATVSYQEHGSGLWIPGLQAVNLGVSSTGSFNVLPVDTPTSTPGADPAASITASAVTYDPRDVAEADADAAVPLRATFRNTGNTSWSPSPGASNGVYLAATSVSGSRIAASPVYSGSIGGWLSSNRVIAGAANEIGPGEEVRFDFLAQMPDDEATFDAYFTLAHAQGGAFTNTTVRFMFEVRPAPLPSRFIARADGRAYLVQDGYRHHLLNVDALQAAASAHPGITDRVLASSDLATFAERPAIPGDGLLFRSVSSPTVYVYEGSTKAAYSGAAPYSVTLTDAFVGAIPDSGPVVPPTVSYSAFLKNQVTGETTSAFDAGDRKVVWVDTAGQGYLGFSFYRVTRPDARRLYVVQQAGALRYSAIKTPVMLDADGSPIPRDIDTDRWPLFGDDIEPTTPTGEWHWEFWMEDVNDSPASSERPIAGYATGTYTVGPVGPETRIIVTLGPGTAPAYRAYSTQMQAAGGTPPYTWSLASGTLPSGLSLNSDGSITGTPTQSITAVLTFRVQDNDGASSVSDALNLIIEPGDTARPSVASHAPYEPSVWDARVPVRFHFDEPMDIGTLAGAFSISPNLGGSIAYGVNGLWMDYVMSEDMQTGVTYTISMNISARDLSGNALSNAVTHSFMYDALPAISSDFPTVFYAFVGEQTSVDLTQYERGYGAEDGGDSQWTVSLNGPAYASAGSDEHLSYSVDAATDTLSLTGIGVGQSWVRSYMATTLQDGGISHRYSPSGYVYVFPRDEDPIAEVYSTLTRFSRGVSGTAYSVGAVVTYPSGQVVIESYDVELYISYDDGATYDLLSTQSVDYSMLFDWTIPLGIYTESARLKTVTQDMFGREGEYVSDAFTIIDGTPPTVAIQEPSTSSVWQTDSSVSISWTSDSRTAVNHVSIYVDNTLLLSRDVALSADSPVHAEAVTVNVQPAFLRVTPEGGSLDFRLPNRESWVRDAAQVRVRVWNAGAVGEETGLPVRIVNGARPPLWPWGVPETAQMGVTTQEGGENGTETVDIAIGNDDVRHMVWMASTGEVMYGLDSGLGELTAVRAIGFGRFPNLDVAPTGSPHAVWVDGSQVMHAEAGPSAGSSWTTPEVIASTNWPYATQMGIDGSDRVHVMYCVNMTGSARHLVRSGGVWTEREVWPEAYAPSMAVAPNGSVHALARPRVDGGWGSFAHRTWTPGTGVWQDHGTQPITSSAAYQIDRGAAADSNSDLHFIYYDGGAEERYYARTLQGVWQPPEPIADAWGLESRMSLAIDRRDVPHVLIARPYASIAESAGVGIVFHTQRETGGWSTPERVSFDYTFGARAVRAQADSENTLHVVWVGSGPSGSRGLFTNSADMGTASDTAPPSLTAPLPTAGIAGESLDIMAPLSDDHSVATTTIFLRPGGFEEYFEGPLYLVEGTRASGEWATVIPSQLMGLRGLVYYVETEDVSGNRSRFGDPTSPQALDIHGDLTLPLRTTPPGSPNVWSVIAPSVVPDDSAVVTTFAALGQYGVDWAAWRWNSGASRWETPAALSGHSVSADAFDVATAWWVAVDGDGTDVDITIPGRSVDVIQSYRVPLDAGWNLIANPYNFPIEWSDTHLRVAYDDQETTLTDAESRAWTHNRATSYDGDLGQYRTHVSDDAGPYAMPPGLGFWLYAAVDGAELVIPPIEAPWQDPDSPVAPAKAERTGWGITLRVDGYGVGDSVEAVYDGRLAAAAQRGLPDLKPPAPPGSDVRVVLVDDRNGGREGLQRLSRPLEEDMIWRVIVSAPAGADLTWDEDAVPGSYRLYLESQSGGEVIDMRARRGTSLPGGGDREMLVRAVRSPAPEQARLLQNYPNPFNPETWIPYDLPEIADVWIHIYDVRGKRVRTLSLGRQYPDSYRELDQAAHWDGADDFGEQVASGVYMYEIRAGSYQARRRMVLLK
jgi:hypothetical protein